MNFLDICISYLLVVNLKLIKGFVFVCISLCLLEDFYTGIVWIIFGLDRDC